MGGIQDGAEKHEDDKLEADSQSVLVVWFDGHEKASEEICSQ